MSRSRKDNFVGDFFFAQELRHRERRVFVLLEIKARNVQTREIDSIVGAMVVWIVLGMKRRIPLLKMPAQDVAKNAAAQPAANQPAAPATQTK